MDREKNFYVYLMTNPKNNVIYTGITNNLIKRVYEHQHKLVNGFTSKYNVIKLVYYESCDDPVTVITREKQIKAGSRNKKIILIEGVNPEWKDLSDDLF